MHRIDYRNYLKISILAVLADRDEYLGGNRVPINVFQSSRSLRTATLRPGVNSSSLKLFQSSRSLRTATCLGRCRGGLVVAISILAVLADRDVNALPFRAYALIIFQSSRSLRTATFGIPTGVPGLSVFQSSRSLRTATL